MHRAPEPLGRVAYFSRAGTKVGYGGRRRPTHGGGNTDRRRAQCATFWVNGHYVPPLSLVRCVSAVRYVFLRGCVLQTCFFAVSVRSRSQLVVSPFFLSPLCVAACSPGDARHAEGLWPCAPRRVLCNPCCGLCIRGRPDCGNLVSASSSPMTASSIPQVLGPRVQGASRHARLSASPVAADLPPCTTHSSNLPSCPCHLCGLFICIRV